MLKVKFYIRIMLINQNLISFDVFMYTYTYKHVFVKILEFHMI